MRVSTVEATQTRRRRKLSARLQMKGGSRELLRETSVQEKAQVKSERMAATFSVSKKRPIVIILVLCIVLIIALGVLLGIFGSRVTSTCETKSAGNRGNVEIFEQ